MRISACVIAKNEEYNISKCLESVREIAHEIIVVDTGSTDKTTEIATNMGAKLYSYEWDGSFANARNYALDKAIGDWVIFLDADEFFTDETKNNIPKILKELKNKKQVAGLLCKCFHIEAETNQVNNSDFLLRIFRNNRKLRYTGKIHEALNLKGFTTIRVPEKLLTMCHTGYSAKIIKSKLERNLDMLLKDLENNKNDKNDAMIHFYLSDCYMGLGKYDLAIQSARLYIDSGLSTVSHNVKPYLTIINSMIAAKYDIDQILVEINVALKKFPTHPDFHGVKGLACFLRRNYSASLEAYEYALNYWKTYDGIEINYMPSYVNEIYYHMGLIHTYKNDYANALEYFMKSLQSKKHDLASFLQLVQIIKCENPEDIILLLKSIYDVSDRRDIEFLVRSLSNLGLGPVMMYFGNIWYKTYGNEDSAIIFMLLNNQKFSDAYVHFCNCYLEEKSDWAALFSVVSALLGEEEAQVKQIREIIPSCFQRVIDLYCGIGTTRTLLEEDLSCFLDLLRELFIFGTDKQFKKLLSIKSLFHVDISESIGDVLCDNLAYGYAIEQFEHALKHKTQNIGELYYKLGFCYYKLNNNRVAASYFEKAIENNYRNCDVFEVMNWILMRTSDSDLNLQLAKLISLNKKVM